MAGSRQAGAQCFAQMSSQFFDKLNATQLCKDRFLNYVQAMFKQETRANDRANAKERKVNSQISKDMTTSFMAEFKIDLREETYLHEKAHASLEMQLELPKELKTYQAQAMEINEQLGAFQNCASAKNTRLAELLTRRSVQDPNNVQDPSSMVSTEAVRLTIRELVSNLTSDIFSRLEGTQLEFNTKLQSRLEVILETVEKHFKDQEHLNADKALPRTVAVHQLNLTNAQVAETWGCASEVTHSFTSLLIQLERVVDAIQTPSPVK
jgi:hypothetical protein